MAFSEFRGNSQIVTALRGAMRANRVPHALLFTGPRGVGKYTWRGCLRKPPIANGFPTTPAANATPASASRCLPIRNA